VTDGVDDATANVSVRGAHRSVSRVRVVRIKTAHASQPGMIPPLGVRGTDH
jgi:hypothetical protein